MKAQAAVSLPVAMRTLLETFRYRAAIAEAAGVDPGEVQEPQGVTLRLTPWFPLAQSEDDPSISPFADDERLTPARMQMLVRNFDPTKYRPPVITGTNCADPGPAHVVGEFNESNGVLVALDWDGLHLWGQAAEIQDPDTGDWRIADAVACGHLGRSIGFWIARPGADGGFMVRHLALLSGEPEGQMAQALPPLSTYFRSLYAPAEAARADAATFRTTRALWPTSTETTLVQEDSPMPLTDAELNALLDRFAVRTNETVTTAVAAAVTPLQATLTAVQADLTATRTTLADRDRSSREAGFRSRTDVLVRAGQLLPAEVDLTVQTLMAVPAETAEALLTQYAARTAAVVTGQPVVVRAGAETVSFEVPVGIDTESLQRAMEAAEGLPEGVAGDALLATRTANLLAQRYGTH